MSSSFSGPSAGLGMIFDAAGIGIVVFDSAGAAIESNRALTDLTGLDAEQILGMNFGDLFRPEEAAPGQELLSAVVSGDRPSYRFEMRYLRLDGSAIRAQLTVVALPRHNGGSPGLIAMISDVTEPRRVYEESRENRVRLEMAIQAANTGFWDWNLQTGQVFYSREWKSQLGYEEHEVSNGLDEWESRVHPDDLPRMLAAARAYIEDPWRDCEAECRLRHKDGSYRWILTRAFMLRDGSGKPHRIFGTHLDITDRKRVQELLREYENVVEGVQEMIVVIDRQYRYLLANPTFLRYRRLTGTQVVGRRIPDFMNPVIFEQLIRPKLDECFRGNVVKFEMRYDYPDLGERDLSVAYFPIDGATTIDRVVCVLEDITERKRAETDLRRAHERLTEELRERTRAEQSVRALTERLMTAQEEERRRIARELHDDLSQEIAASSISVSNLKRHIPEEDVELRAHADGLHQRIARLAEHVRDLSHQLHPAVLEYSGIAAALRSYSAKFSASTGIAVNVEAMGPFEDIPAAVGLCLYRVAQEALQNVAKHAKSSTATVRVERCSDSVQLVIKDAGRGFENSPGRSGGGLGLVSMRERVRLVNGRFRIDSALGGGTTITASIPCL